MPAVHGVPVGGGPLYVSLKRGYALPYLLHAPVYASLLLCQVGQGSRLPVKLFFLVLYEPVKLRHHGGKCGVVDKRMMSGATQRARLAVVQAMAVSLPIVACHERVRTAQGVQLSFQAFGINAAYCRLYLFTSLLQDPQLHDVLFEARLFIIKVLQRLYGRLDVAKICVSLRLRVLKGLDIQAVCLCGLGRISIGQGSHRLCEPLGLALCLGSRCLISIFACLYIILRT